MVWGLRWRRPAGLGARVCVMFGWSLVAEATSPVGVMDVETGAAGDAGGGLAAVGVAGDGVAQRVGRRRDHGAAGARGGAGGEWCEFAGAVASW